MPFYSRILENTELYKWANQGSESLNNFIKFLGLLAARLELEHYLLTSLVFYYPIINTYKFFPRKWHLELDKYQVTCFIKLETKTQDLKEFYL